MDEASDISTHNLADRVAGRIARYGVIAIVAILPFVAYLGLRTPVRSQVYFFKLATMGVFCAWSAVRIFGSNRSRPFDVPDMAVGLSAAAVIASALFSSEPAYAMTNALPWLSGLALFVLLRAGSRRGDLFPALSWIIVVQAGCLALYGIFQEHGFEILPYSDSFQKNQVIATFGHPNFFGSFMAPAFLICLFRACVPGRKVWRGLALVVAAVIAYALVRAQARAATIGLFLGLVFAASLYFVAHPVSKTGPGPAADPGGKGSRRLAIPPRLVAAALCILVAAPLAYRPAKRIFIKLISRKEFENRLLFWRIATETHAPWDLIGIGAGSYGRVFWGELMEFQGLPVGEYYGRNVNALRGPGGRSVDPGNVHNDYLEIWAEAGPLGLFAHLTLAAYLIFFFGMRLIRPPPEDDPDRWTVARLTCLAGAFVAMLFDGTLGFPLTLPCSLVLYWIVAASMNEVIERGA